MTASGGGGRWAASPSWRSLAGVGWVALRSDVVPFLAPTSAPPRSAATRWCSTPSQARYAGLITAIAVQRGLPARAASIALATAYQESDLRNLDGGDRDSAGLFQQRPSQGWGTLEEVRDPVHATNAFYDALAKVDGYEQLEITEAAQEVQRSGFPDAYADHEADARALASALTRQLAARRSAAGSATSRRRRRRELKASGLTARADAVRRDLGARFPDQPLGGFAPGRRLDRPHGGVGALRRPRRSTSSCGRSRRPTGSAAGRSRSTSSARPTGSTSRR